MRLLQLCVPVAHPPGAALPRSQANEPREKGARMSTAVATTIVEVRTSPHLHAARSVDQIMRNVIYALLPVTFYAVWLFGISALFLIFTTTLTCVVAEHLACRASGKPTSVNDFSVMITG